MPKQRKSDRFLTRIVNYTKSGGQTYIDRNMGIDLLNVGYDITTLSSGEGIEAQINFGRVHVTVGSDAFMDPSSYNPRDFLINLYLVQTQGNVTDVVHSTQTSTNGILDEMIDDIYSYRLIGTMHPKAVDHMPNGAIIMTRVFTIPQRIYQFLLEEYSSGEEGTATQDNIHLIAVIWTPNNENITCRFSTMHELNYVVAPRKMEFALR